MDSSLSLPLFVNLDDPLAVYVLDNKLIGCISYGEKEHIPIHSFNLLLQLTKYKTMTDFIPSTLQKYFLTTKKLSTFSEWNYLIGTTSADGDFFSLDLSLDYQPNNQDVITLTNFKYLNQPFNLKLQLPFVQAFSLFANICANSRCSVIWQILKDKKIYPLDSTAGRLAILENAKRSISTFGREWVFVNLFIFDYLVYLKEQLLTTKISPLEILQQSGAMVLVFLGDLPPVAQYIQEIMKDLLQNHALTFNQKLIYYTVLKLIYFDTSIGKLVKDFCEENSKLIHDLEHLLIRKFPKSAKELEFLLQKI